jgi:hypothetical protein
MSHKHDALIETIFREPVNTNIHWREVESLLGHLGADVEQIGGGRIRAQLAHAERVLHRPHHGSTLDRGALRELRGFLAAAGHTPSTHAMSRG